jgi:hypothetical protein
VLFRSEEDFCQTAKKSDGNRKTIGENVLHQNLCNAICRKFGGRAFLGWFYDEDDMQKTPINTGENDGRPEWIRTIDLFRVKEALWTN